MSASHYQGATFTPSGESEADGNVVRRDEQTRGDLHLPSAVWFVIAIAILLILGAVWGALGGDFWADMSALGSLPWGWVVVADVYSGLVLVASWIAWREGSFWRVFPWFVALATFGNIASCLYISLALFKSKRCAKKFFLGARSPE